MRSANIYSFGKLRRRRGFTLIETALATIIVGLGSTALLMLIARATASGDDAAQLTTAVHLANNVHELCERLGYSNPVGWGPQSTINYVTDLSGNTYSDSAGTGPLDGRGNVLTGFTGWSQTVVVNSANTSNFTTTQPTNNGTTYPMERVTVTVKYGGNAVFSTNWIVVQ